LAGVSGSAFENNNPYFIYIGVILLVAVAGYFVQVVVKEKYGGAQDENEFSEGSKPLVDVEIKAENQPEGDNQVGDVENNENDENADAKVEEEVVAE